MPLSPARQIAPRRNWFQPNEESGYAAGRSRSTRSSPKKMFGMIRRTNFAGAVFGLPSLFGLTAACLMGCPPRLHSTDEQQPFGIDHRIPWTTSRVVGSPDPPLPYTIEKTFTNIQWKAPIFIAPEPGTDRLLVVQAGG